MKKPGAGSAGRFEGALQQRRRQRARRILLATGVLMLLVGAFWSLFFAVQGAYLHAAVELVLMLLGALVTAAAQRGRTRAASWLAFAGLLAYVCFFTAFLDVQTATIPRTTHLFLVVLAAGAHFVFRDEPQWLRYACVAVFLLAFM